jgi:hypothetical protein
MTRHQSTPDLSVIPANQEKSHIRHPIDMQPL